jgi:hypothetical protein
LGTVQRPTASRSLILLTAIASLTGGAGPAQPSAPPRLCDRGVTARLCDDRCQNRVHPGVAGRAAKSARRDRFGPDRASRPSRPRR